MYVEHYAVDLAHFVPHTHTLTQGVRNFTRFLIAHFYYRRLISFMINALISTKQPSMRLATGRVRKCATITKNKK